MPAFFSIVAAQAQESKFLNSPARKLQLAEFAIANLYVDEVNEESWWKKLS